MTGFRRRNLWAVFTVFLLLNICFWFQTKDLRARWLNVPPVPKAAGVKIFGLGDAKLSYRVIGVMLQNMGDTGGRTTALRDYDYEALARWFYLADKLDPVSNFVPVLAAYYYGSGDPGKKVAPLVDYLEYVGNRPEGEKWRWLAHAVYLARFQMNDTEKAYELATKLANIKNDQMPMWARQMPAFILNAKGDKEAAYDIMIEILKTKGDKLHPNEVNAMRDYICTRLLDKKQAAENPLCTE